MSSPRADAVTPPRSGRRFAGAHKGLGRAQTGVARPAVALVSPAARTRATADLVLADMAEPPEQRHVASLYGAEPEEVLDLLRALPDEVGAAMVVGHNPTAQVLAQGLLAHADAEGRSLSARHGFPTCALGVFRFEATHWADVDAGTATLVTLLTPPY